MALSPHKIHSKSPSLSGLPFGGETTLFRISDWWVTETRPLFFLATFFSSYPRRRRLLANRRGDSHTCLIDYTTQHNSLGPVSVVTYTTKTTTNDDAEWRYLLVRAR